MDIYTIQADRQLYTQTGIYTGRQIVIYTDRDIYRQIDSFANLQVWNPKKVTDMKDILYTVNMECVGSFLKIKLEF